MLGFVTGLAAEARILAGRDVLTVVAGGSVSGVEVAVRDVIARGATALISFGLAGGLDPCLPAGSLILPRMVISGDSCYLCDLNLTEILGGPTADSVTGSLDVVATRESKQALHLDTSATAVDLESTIVARIASELGIPFAVLRAVADPAWRTLPPASLCALNASGHIVLWPVFKNIVSQPCQLLDLLRLARDAAVARASLAKHVRKLQIDLHI